MKPSNPVQKRRVLCLLAIASLLLMTTAFNKIKEIGTRNTFKNLSVINNKLEKLEINLRNSDLKETCSNANTALRIIARKEDGLKKLEPYYDWKEIKQLLQIISDNSCNV